MGLIPAGAYRNREFCAAMIHMADSVARKRQDLLFDPQTSGGLLISVKADQAGDLVNELQAVGMAAAAFIGEVVDDPAEKIHVE